MLIRKWRATKKGGDVPSIDEVEIVDRISNGPPLEEGVSGTNGKAQEILAERVPVPSQANIQESTGDDSSSYSSDGEPEG